LYRLPVNIETF